LVRIRLGYVALAIGLEDCSPSRTITVTNLSKIEGEENQKGSVRRLARENLNNTLRILRYNVGNGIAVYRFSSKLIPLATHPAAQHWDLLAELNRELDDIGAFVHQHRLRVSLHPDHFTVINAADPAVFGKSLIELEYHEALLRSMNLGPTAKVVLHIGGCYRDHATSLTRFEERFAGLPPSIRSRLVVENDDKLFGAADVLKVSQKLGIPMVLDVHHHFCHNSGEELADLLPEIFRTWNGEIPKIHFSSPKNDKNCRYHSNFIEAESFLSFIRIAKKVGSDFDVMLEAKQKDLALFQLLQELKQAADLEIGPGAGITVS